MRGKGEGREGGSVRGDDMRRERKVRRGQECREVDLDSGEKFHPAPLCTFTAT